MIARSVSLSLSHSLTRDDDEDVLSLSLSSRRQTLARAFNGERRCVSDPHKTFPLRRCAKERRRPNAFTRAIIIRKRQNARNTIRALKQLSTINHINEKSDKISDRFSVQRGRENNCADWEVCLEHHLCKYPMRFLGVLNASNARRSQSSMSSNTHTTTNYAIVGLGNPGKRFEGTRHNVGFEVIDSFAQESAEASCWRKAVLLLLLRSSSSLRLQNNSSVNSEISDVVLAEYIVNDEEENEGDDDESKSCRLPTRKCRRNRPHKPQTFMNVSGTAVRKIMRKYRVPIENVLVVYDDLDTKVGQIRIKKSGSHGGHNGIRDIWIFRE